MLISDLKLLLEFETVSLYERVSGTTMVTLGTPISPQILSGGGYVMSDTQYLVGEGPGYNGYVTGVSDAMTLGFWLYPVNPGMAVNPVNSSAMPISMPVMDFNDTDTSNAPVIRLTENTTAGGENNLTVSFNDGVYYASSEDYAPSMWHHFWIVYDGASLSIYVDGLQHTLQGETGVIPPGLAGNRLDLYINHVLDGYAYNIAKNYGYISDIFLLNVTNTSETDMQRVINDGIKYVVDDSYTDTDIDKSSIYFNDPDTIVVTSSIDDMSYVYFGRNDGKILRGSSLMWETRRTFASDGEASLLGLTSADIVNGFLELKNNSVRL